MKLQRKHTTLFLISITGLVLVCFLNYHYKLFAINYKGSDYSGESLFSIMTFNIDATDSTAFTIKKQSQLMQLIRSEHPDILCFQELSFENLKKIIPQLDSIYGSCEELDGRDVERHRSKFYSRYRMRNYLRYQCKGMLDTTEFEELDYIQFDQDQKQMLVMSAEFEIESGRWVTVFSGHLRSSAYSTARRSMNKDANWWDGLSLYWHNYKVGKRIRDYEAENVRRSVEHVRAEAHSASLDFCKPVIIVGDLNDWCGSDCLETLMGDDLKDAWWEGGNGFGWTYFGWNLRLRLDHILYSDELELVDVKVVDTDQSDHKPLMVRFRLK